MKKILCFLCTFVILIPLVAISASADYATESVNMWSVNMWSDFFGEDYDLSKYTDDIIADLETMSDKSNQGLFLSGGEAYLYATDDDISFYNTGNYFRPISDNSFKSDIMFTGNSVLNISSYGSTYNSSLKKHIINNHTINSSDFVIVNDIDSYNSLVAGCDYPDNIFYCENPVQSFLLFLKSDNVDLNPIVPPDGFDNVAIKYSDYGDNPYTKYLFKPYEVDTENYVTSGLFSDLNIYYDSYFDFGSTYDHNETIDFYVSMSSPNDNSILVDDYHDYFEYALYDYYTGVDLPDLTNFFNAHFRCVHYEKDSYSMLDFFNSVYGTSYASLNNFFTLERIDNKYYFKFTLKSEYTISNTGVSVEPGSSNITNNSTMFFGHRVTHTCSHIDPNSGLIGGSGDGLGSDISQADDTMSRPPTKDELENLGFEHGYPNTSGNYPYKITIYRNGVEYFQMFINTMPSVSSTYYSDKCIDYGVNVNNKKIYLYFKEQNMSKVIDFTTNEDDMYYSDGHVLENPITDGALNILNSLLNVDTSEFNNTYTLHLWTNYTGEFPDNMNGFYCKFNWDLENSGHFQKNNSDDDYDYSQDFEADEGFTDNNGNIHGGAVETPTEDSSYNGFNNEDFTFEETSLWGYANSFLTFSFHAFKTLPAFIWSLLGCGIVIMIILRILGR